PTLFRSPRGLGGEALEDRVGPAEPTPPDVEPGAGVELDPLHRSAAVDLGGSRTEEGGLDEHHASTIPNARSSRTTLRTGEISAPAGPTAPRRQSARAGRRPSCRAAEPSASGTRPSCGPCGGRRPSPRSGPSRSAARGRWARSG